MATKHLLKLYKITADLASEDLIGTHPIKLYAYAPNINDATLHFHDYMMASATAYIGNKMIRDYEMRNIEVDEVEFKEGVLS